MSDVNVKLLKSLYEAFARGDLLEVIDSCTEDVDWSATPASTSLPWYGKRTGKAGVESFFADLAGNTEIVRFEPISFTSNDDDEVMVFIDWSFKVHSTGKVSQGYLLHFWRLENGKIAYFRGAEDSEQSVNVFS